MEVDKLTGKRQRQVSPATSPRQATPDTAVVVKAKRRRLESATETDTKQVKGHSSKLEEEKTISCRKRRHSILVLKENTVEIKSKKNKEEEKPTTKKRRLEEKRSLLSPPPFLPASPLAHLREKHPQTASKQEPRAKEEEKEEKARFPPSPIIIPSLQLEEMEEIPREDRRDATYTNLEEFAISSQGSDADLVAACANLHNDIVRCSQDSLNSEEEQDRHEISLRTVQVTPPPSARMLDRKNPPPPPKRPKRRNYGRIVYARTYPRLALSPLVDNSPPNSPRVFRSLENEFAYAMQDTPEIRPRIRPAPRMARGTRRSTRAGYSRAQRSLDTPTSTMVLRSRQLNPTVSVGGGKPESRREREQRNAVRRQ